MSAFFVKHHAVVAPSTATTFFPKKFVPKLTITQEISFLYLYWFLVLYRSRLSALLSDASAEDEKKLEKMKKWKDWRDKLNSKYKKTRGKFNKVKGQGIPKQPKKVQERLQLTRVRIFYIALLIVPFTAYWTLIRWTGVFCWNLYSGGSRAGARGGAPLIFRPKWRPKDRKKVFLRPTPPPHPPPPYMKVWIRHCYVPNNS